MLISELNFDWATHEFIKDINTNSVIDKYLFYYELFETNEGQNSKVGFTKTVIIYVVY